MIEALFNQPNYLAVKKMMDATILRQEAIASNLANMETPNYRRVDVATAFQDQLRQAIGSHSPEQLKHLTPRLEVDPKALPLGRDGNTVQLENELMAMDENTVTHAFETQLVSGSFSRLRLAITGKA